METILICIISASLIAIPVAVLSYLLHRVALKRISTDDGRRIVEYMKQKKMDDEIRRLEMHNIAMETFLEAQNQRAIMEAQNKMILDSCSFIHTPLGK